MKKFLKKNILIICLILISIIRINITGKLPIMALPKQVYDDGLMVKLSKSIISGHWLGDYDSDTLIKGVGFPVFLSVLKFLNIPYLFGMDVLYVLACFYFLYSIKDEIKSNVLKLVIFLLMIFNPISYGELTFQRAYRGGIVLFQTIFIFSAIYIIWKNRNEGIKKLLPHILLASFNTAFLWHTKEDGIWIMPFLVTSIVLTIIFILIEFFKNKKNPEKVEKTEKQEIKNNSVIKLVGKLVLITMPLWILIFSSLSIKTLNYIKYGVFVEKETDSNFGKALNAFYEVKPNENVYRTDNTREKIDRICEVSETLNSIKSNMDNSFDVWTQFDNDPKDREVENGWFSWALKHAASTAGIYLSPQQSNEFYGKVYDEIEAALDSGKLEREENLIISSMPPFRDEYRDKFCSFSLGYMQYIYEFREIECSNRPSKEYDGIDNLKIRDFEFVTGNSSVERDHTKVRICGWYFLNNGEDFKLYLTNEDDVKIAEIDRIESPDIAEIFSISPDIKYRFDFVITDVEEVSDYEELYLSTYDLNGKQVEKVSLKDYLQDVRIEGENSTYLLALVSIDKEEDPVKTLSDRSVKILNGIASIYKEFGTPLFFTSIIAYYAVFVMTIISMVKSKKLTEEFNVLLILTAFFLSIIVVVIGVAYTGLSACYTLIYMYLSVTYPLLVMFMSLGIGYSIQKICTKIFVKKEGGKNEARRIA